MWLIAALLAAPGARADDAQELPSVIVTSQKIAQSLEEVPASVSTVDGETIRATGAHSLTDMQDYIPNVSIAQNHTAATIAIRGFATPDTNPGFDPSVGAVVDGIYYGRSQFLTAFFHDMDRIEVLRGPQGTLFGKNSTAGVMSIVTQAPGNEWLVQAEAQQTSFGELSLQPVLQIPLGQDLSIRVSGDYRHGSKGVLYNTFLQRPENNPQSDSTRLRLRYAPDTLISFDFEAFTSREKFNNNGFQNSVMTARMRQALMQYDPAIDSNIDKYNSQSFPSLSDGVIRGLSGTFTFNIDGQMGVPDLKVLTIIGVADSITSKKELDADFSPIDFLDNTQAAPSYYKQLTDEIRLVGQGQKIFGFGHGYNFVTGFFLSSNSFRDSGIYRVEDLGGAAAYCNATSDFCGVPIPGILPGSVGSDLGLTLGPVLNAFTSLAGGAADQTAHLNLDQTGHSWAFFGQTEAFLLEHWALIGGLRYGDEVKDGFASSHSTSPLVKAITSQVDHDTPLHLEERDISPKAGFKWEPDKRLTAYATWSRGYKSGGFNALPLAPTNLQYQPERAESFEIGSKGITEFLGTPVRLSAAVYDTSFDNLQVSAFLNGNFVVLNAASARSRGLDLDFHWLTPVTGFSVTGA
ncbi:MAG TPA: TonB-dependent receptor, partial [Nevskiaceae bacterium]|nr:TonB-dependent receptor [Nevskiaceae bacterium]